MFPKFLYELLPYLYLSAGVGGGYAINSAIVLVASIALIMAGVIVLFMRISYRRNIRQTRHL
ncbi:MAG TPA: hypothetical protein ENJ87_13200 [Gammaproteobacteria bacterium]|nr:hypothetical protein [Gammaproteobacteria bacterium]